MKNKDMPAMPVFCESTGYIQSEATGLTKREMFAMHAMQGWLASGAAGDFKEFAEYSVKMADALLAELEK